MKYIKFVLDTGYCGTEQDEYAVYNDNVTDAMLNADLLEMIFDYGESYEHYATGWDNENLDNPEDEDELKEVLDNFYNEIAENSYWTEITKEEYEKGVE